MTTKNVVFIDSRVAGYETLMAGLSADTKWYLLDAHPNGINQMQRSGRIFGTGFGSGHQPRSDGDTAPLAW